MEYTLGVDFNINPPGPLGRLVCFLNLPGARCEKRGLANSSTTPQPFDS